MSDILLQSRDARGVVTLTLNDPARFNALGQEMLQALQEALDTLALDEQLRAVVLAAHGKAFCAGHNLKDMGHHFGVRNEATRTFTEAAIAELFRTYKDLDGLYGLQGSTCEGTLLLLPFLTQAVSLVSTRPLLRLLIGWRLVW